MSPQDFFRWAFVLWLVVAGLQRSGQCARPGDANWDSRFDAGCDKTVYALAAAGSSVYVGGYFNTVGAIGASRVAKWDGTNWSALGSGIGADGVVYAICVSGSDVYVGGAFTEAGGQPAWNVARWDGANWFPVGSNAPAVTAIAAQGGEVFIGHRSPSAAVGPYLGKWDGSNWVSLGGGVTETTGGGEALIPVRSLVVRGGDLYVGGQFKQVGHSVRATNIARWNGTTWYPVGGGLQYASSFITNTYTVASMLLFGNDLYVCGNFNRVGGQNITNVAKWNGATWTAVGQNYWSSLNAIAVTSPGVFVGGTIAPYIDGLTKGITKWDLTQWVRLGSGVEGTVYALAAVGNDIYVGGRFSTAGGRPSTNFAVWHDMPGIRTELLAQGMRNSWPTQYSGLILERATNVAGLHWTNANVTPSIYNGRYAVTNLFLKPAEFFRLRRP